MAWDDKADIVSEHPAWLSEENDVALWRARSIGGLLAHAPRLNSSSLRTVFTANFRACVDAVAEGNRRAFAGATRVSQCTVNYQMVGKSLPRISTLLRICYHLNIPLTALLESDSAHLAADLAQAKDAIRKHRQLPLSRTPEQVHLVLENALREQPVPSLSELARRLGYKGVERLYQVDRNLPNRYSCQLPKVRTKPLVAETRCRENLRSLRHPKAAGTIACPGTAGLCPSHRSQSGVLRRWLSSSEVP